MGLFGDLDVASAADDPFKVPANSYRCLITEVKVGKTKDESKTGMTINYHIQDGEHEGKNISEWKQIPTPADPKSPTPDEARALSFLKSRLADFGIPESRMNSVEPDDLIGLEVVVRVAEGKNGYMNVKKVTLVEGNFSAEGNGSFSFS